jgi:hypothetical protein
MTIEKEGQVIDTPAKGIPQGLFIAVLVHFFVRDSGEIGSRRGLVAFIDLFVVGEFIRCIFLFGGSFEYGHGAASR